MKHIVAILFILSALLCSFAAAYPQSGPCGPPPNGVRPSGPPPSGPPPTGRGPCGPPNGQRPTASTTTASSG
ncbi:proline, histidine and glycine-rich protein 1 [Teleopsis dalmanni]|uniref:proline, histidine and glycine-rich protein 1 n=1 Tax=Teleopsis dalmanni TaxID=139649 RepID=UPI000D32A35A|nr:proline, histidine and glycine-rich protein 1 [Teleopsis dalmanni]